MMRCDQGCPQQKDGHSCGPILLRNARRRMIGVSVGEDCDRLDGLGLRAELVEVVNSCIRQRGLHEGKAAAMADEDEDLIVLN